MNTAALVRWYRRHHRAMPWRPVPGRCGDPYRVLVSETMLQQTQVATVTDYFRRFVKRFPTIRQLAAADEQDVLRLWQGLGYYRRARHLHQAAQVIVNDLRGRIPDTADQLLKLPGVGRYTAGAMASIAFGKREPILDGNAARVLARLHAVEEPADSPVGRERLWELAGRMVRHTRHHPGDVNQALMELGATVCTSKSPRCPACPVREWCAALKQNRVEELPTRSQRARQRDVRHEVVAIRRNGRLLVEQRPDDGLWAGMWQVTTREGCGSPRATRRGEFRVRENGAAAAWIKRRFGLMVELTPEVGRFVHLTSHRRITFTLRHAAVKSGRLKRGHARWRRLDDLHDLPMSNAQRRVIGMLRAGRNLGAGSEKYLTERRPGH